MKLGIFAKTFLGDDPGKVLEAVKAAGFDSAQYNWACAGLASMPDAIPDAELERTRQAFQTHRVSAVALSGTFNMIHPEKALVERGLSQLQVVINSAATLDIPMVTLCTGTRNPDDQWAGHPDNDLPQAWSDLLKAMEPAVRMAEAAGICLGVEPELANTVNSVEKAEQLMRQFDTPHLRVVLDPANLFEVVSDAKRCEIIGLAIEQLAPHISLCHAKDRRADGSFCVAGEGVIDYPHYLATLQRIGYTGPMVTHGLTVSDAPRVASFLKSLMCIPE